MTFVPTLKHPGTEALHLSDEMTTALIQKVISNVLSILIIEM